MYTCLFIYEWDNTVNIVGSKNIVLEPLRIQNFLKQPMYGELEK